MDELKTQEQRIKKATMDEKTCQRFCQLLGKKSIPRAVVDEWAQFKVYGDRLGIGSMQMPGYVMMFIAQKAGACPHIPVTVEVNGDVEAEAETEPIVTTVLTMEPVNKPYTGKRRGRPPGSGKKPDHPKEVKEPELVEVDG